MLPVRAARNLHFDRLAYHVDATRGAGPYSWEIPARAAVRKVRKLTYAVAEPLFRGGT